jgi:hypothetical protein
MAPEPDHPQARLRLQALAWHRFYFFRTNNRAKVVLGEQVSVKYTYLFSSGP